MTLASLADAPSHDTMIQHQSDDHHSTTSPLPRDTLICPVQTPPPSITRDRCLREHTVLPPSYFLPPADIHFETTAAPTTFLPFATHALSIELHLTNIRSFTQNVPLSLSLPSPDRATDFPSIDSNLPWSHASTFSPTPPTICPSRLRITSSKTSLVLDTNKSTTFDCITTQTTVHQSAMPRLKATLLVLALSHLSVFTQVAYAAPKPQAAATTAAAGSTGYWLASIERTGTVAFAQTPSYPIYRNVKTYGATGKSRPTAPG